MEPFLMFGVALFAAVAFVLSAWSYHEMRENQLLAESLAEARRNECEWRDAYTAECEARLNVVNDRDQCRRELADAIEDRKEADESIERRQLAELPSLRRNAHESGEFHPPYVPMTIDDKPTTDRTQESED